MPETTNENQAQNNLITFWRALINPRATVSATVPRVENHLKEKGLIKNKVALYARVSTGGQDPSNQLEQLREVASQQGWKIVGEYVDVISGATSSRPELDKLVKAVMRGEVAQVACWDVTRLGRSLQHLTRLLSDLHAKGCDLYLHVQGMDTRTPSGKAMFQMLGVFAEFEREMIRERTLAGLERARAKGKRLGRPPVPPVVRGQIVELRRQGLSLNAIVKKVGVSKGVVVSACHEVFGNVGNSIKAA